MLGDVIVSGQGDMTLYYCFGEGSIQVSTQGTLYIADSDLPVSAGEGYSLAAADGIYLESGGVLQGGGTIDGDLTNDGEIDLGGTSTTVTVNGNYSQTNSGTLLAGLGSPAIYGQLLVTGNASLDGTLTAELVDNFTPALGDQFPVLTFGSVNGDFATKNLTLGQGQVLIPLYSTHALTLTLPSILTPTLSVTDAGGTYNGNLFSAVGTALWA